MRIFRQKKQRVFGIIDVGSGSLKSLLFAVPEDTKNMKGRMVVPHIPKPIDKFVWELPESYSGVWLARKIRESIFHLVRRLEEIPERIIIALGPTVAECGLHMWSVPPGAGGRMLTRRDIRATYHDLFASQNDLRRAVIVEPIEALVNGYPLVWRGRGARQAFGREREVSARAQDASERAQDAVLPRARVEEISFRTLSLYMSVENGATFAEIKNALGGIPVVFVPLAVAYTEAVVHGLGMRDALVVDVGGSETTLLSLRGGRFSHAAFTPFGTRRFAGRTAAEIVRARRHGTPGTLSQGYPATQPSAISAAGRTAAATSATQWKQSFVSALGSFAAAGSISENLLLAGGGAYVPELRSALLAPDWMGQVSHVSVPRMRVLEGSAFFGGDTLEGFLQGPEDAGLGALAVYASAHQSIF